MSISQIILDDAMKQYLETNTWRETEILKQLRHDTEQLPMARMISAPEAGQFFALLIKLLQAKRAIEVGTFTGYASLWMAQALPDDGQLICCDTNAEWPAIGERYWRQAKVEHKIQVKIASAHDTLAELCETQAESFDFIFIDADKASYDDYYEYSLKLLRAGGLVVLDNVLLDGRVADATVTTGKVDKMRVLNKKIQNDTRVDMCCLPLRDGFILALKR